MSTSKINLWVSDGDLWRCGVHHWEVRDTDVERDNIRFGYWVNSRSPTATILALKGCNLVRQDPATKWISESALT